MSTRPEPTGTAQVSSITMAYRVPTKGMVSSDWHMLVFRLTVTADGINGLTVPEHTGAADSTPVAYSVIITDPAVVLVVGMQLVSEKGKSEEPKGKALQPLE